jgi:hypothetical protein
LLLSSLLLSFLVSLSLLTEILGWSRFNEASVDFFHLFSYSPFVIILDVAHVENHENIHKLNSLVFTLTFKLTTSRVWSLRSTYVIK